MLQDWCVANALPTSKGVSIRCHRVMAHSNSNQVDCLAKLTGLRSSCTLSHAVFGAPLLEGRQVDIAVTPRKQPRKTNERSDLAKAWSEGTYVFADDPNA